ncbi:hypothetical protein TYRP_014389 [Tyrophagus putrescentiae]|nr:hypothetical protein TYRP_014389 [Tyrophagus putrescentiae]
MPREAAVSDLSQLVTSRDAEPIKFSSPCEVALSRLAIAEATDFEAARLQLVAQCGHSAVGQFAVHLADRFDGRLQFNAEAARLGGLGEGGSQVCQRLCQLLRRLRQLNGGGLVGDGRHRRARDAGQPNRRVDKVLACVNQLRLLAGVVRLALAGLHAADHRLNGRSHLTAHLVHLSLQVGVVVVRGGAVHCGDVLRGHGGGVLCTRLQSVHHLPLEGVAGGGVGRREQLSGGGLQRRLRGRVVRIAGTALGRLHQTRGGVGERLGGRQKALLYARIGLALRLALDVLNQLGGGLSENLRLFHHLRGVAGAAEKAVCGVEDGVHGGGLLVRSSPVVAVVATGAQRAHMRQQVVQRLVHVAGRLIHLPVQVVVLDGVLADVDDAVHGSADLLSLRRQSASDSWDCEWSEKALQRLRAASTRRSPRSASSIREAITFTSRDISGRLVVMVLMAAPQRRVVHLVLGHRGEREHLRRGGVQRGHLRGDRLLLHVQLVLAVAHVWAVLLTGRSGVQLAQCILDRVLPSSDGGAEGALWLRHARLQVLGVLGGHDRRLRQGRLAAGANDARQGHILDDRLGGLRVGLVLHDGRLGGRHAVLHHRRALVAINAKVVLGLLPLEDDVDVAGDELRDLLALGGLHRVVTVGVVAKVEREAVRRRRPPLDGGQRPGLQVLLRLLVQSEDAVFGDAQQAGHQFVLSLHLLLHEEKGDAVGFQGTRQGDVLHLGVHIRRAHVPHMLHKNLLLDVLLSSVVFGEKVLQQERLLLRFDVIAVLHLTLDAGKLAGLVKCHGVRSVDDRIARLHVQQMQLHRIARVDVLTSVSSEETSCSSSVFEWSTQSRSSSVFSFRLIFSIFGSSVFSLFRRSVEVFRSVPVPPFSVAVPSISSNSRTREYSSELVTPKGNARNGNGGQLPDLYIVI